MKQLIWTDKRYGYKRHPAYLYNALSAQGYCKRDIPRGMGVYQFIGTLPRPVQLAMVEYIFKWTPR